MSKAAAKRGAKFLDSHVPRWYTCVDEEKLKMGSLDDCILGQIFGDFGRGMVALGITDRVRELGFDYLFTGNQLRTGLQRLYDGWVEEIKRRKKR